MSTIDRKELGNELYDALLYILGGTAISMASGKLLKEGLTKADTPVEIAKLTTAIGAGVLLVKWLQQKKYLPVDPFKSS